MQTQRLSWSALRPPSCCTTRLPCVQGSASIPATAIGSLRCYHGHPPPPPLRPLAGTVTFAPRLVTPNTHRQLTRAAAASNRQANQVASRNGTGGAGADDADPNPNPRDDDPNDSSSSGSLSGVLDNSSMASMDWNDWMLSSSSSSTDGGEMLLPPGLSVSLSGQGAGDENTVSAGAAATIRIPSVGRANAAATGASEGGSGSEAAAGAASAIAPAAGPAAATVRIAFYAVGASFDRRQLEGRLRAAYGSQAVRKYPDVVHCQVARSREAQPGADLFFFDFGVLACWGLTPDAERTLVRDLAAPCAVQPLPYTDHEMDVFRCTFATNPLLLPSSSPDTFSPTPAPCMTPTPAPAPASAAPAHTPADAFAAATAAAVTSGGALPAAAPLAAPGSDPSASLLDITDATTTTTTTTTTTGGTTSNRRFTRRAERSSGAAAAGGAPTTPVVPPAPVVVGAAAVPVAVAPAAVPVVAPVAAAAVPQPAAAAAPAAPPPPPQRLPPAAGPFSVLYFPPKIANDTVLLHVRHCGDTATLLAVSYALAQSTKMSAFEKAVETLIEDTRYLPEALAEEGEVHLTGKEIGRLLGKVFVLKRSVNLLSGVSSTPEFFWYAPDELQALYARITEYVELNDRVEQLNARFAVLQEMLELVRAQEENRHGNRLEWIVIWLIVVEVVLGVFELLELFGVIGPQHGGGM